MSRIARAFLFGCVLGTASCGSCGDKKEEHDAQVAEAPVPAPENLIADLYATSPNNSWSKLQRGIGGPMGILPAALPAIIAMYSDLDVRVADEIDGTAPMFGAVAGDPAHPAYTLAMKLGDPRRARMVLTDGETAAFTPREDAPAGLTHLVPKTKTNKEHDPTSAAALTANGYLVVGAKPDDLSKLSPYVTRSLPQKPLPKEGAIVADVPRSAVTKVLAPKLESLWEGAKGYLGAEDERMRREHGGRPPDFGDPQAIVAALDVIVGRRIAIFRDLDHVRFAFDVNEDAMLVTATLTPLTTPADNAAKKWLDGMRVGDAATVLSLSSASALALSTRDTEDDRNAQAAEIEKAVTNALGDRLKEPDAKKLHATLDDWTKGRDETIAVAYTAGEGALLTTRARDAEAANRAFRSAVDLTKVAPFKDLLHVKDVTTTTEDLPPFGKVTVAKIEREAPKPPPNAKGDAGAPMMKPSPQGLAWTTEGGTVTAAFGGEPATVLKSARPEKKLRDDPLVSRFATNVGDTASTILVVQPLRLDPRRAQRDQQPAAAPVAFALTRKGTDAVLRFDVSDALLRELSRLFMGF